MKTSTHKKYLLLAVASICGTSASFASRLLNDIPEAGFSFLPVTNSTKDAAIEAEVAEALEAGNRHVKVVGVSLVSLICDSLASLEDADVLEFAISEDKSVVAEQDAYVTFDGEAFDDHVDRHIWSGTVTDSAQGEDQTGRSTIRMTWGLDCDPEIFLWKMITHNKDGTTSVLKTVPCDAGGGSDICLAEVSIEFQKESVGKVPQGEVDSEISKSGVAPYSHRELTSASGTGVARSVPSSTDAVITRNNRNLQSTDCSINIDVLYVYTKEAAAALGHATDTQMMTTILDGIEVANMAMANSQISLTFTVKQAIEIELTNVMSTLEALEMVKNSELVASWRDEYEADLVQIIASPYTEDLCGLGYVFDGSDEYGFSIIEPTCIDSLSSQVHEIGHNLGCLHDRDSHVTADQKPYAHATKYCDDDSLAYRTMMSTQCRYPNETVAKANLFSNPNVVHLGQATGTETENNARAIEDNMVLVANYRGPTVDSCS